jgi:peroxiredoxin Q/BCP
MTLKVGDKAPEFSLVASTGETVSLRDLADKKVVLYFYPRDDTPGCTKEACSFRDANAQLKAAGVEVLGVSADGLSSHRQFAEKYGLPFPLLADEEKVVANAYGAWGERQVRGRTVVGVKRMTFLIDEQGTIQKIWPAVTPDDHAQEVLEAVRAIG